MEPRKVRRIPLDLIMAPWMGWRDAWRDLRKVAAIDYQAQVPHPLQALLLFVVPLMLAWLVYVPIHELLHVAGAALTGVEGFRLEIDALYGGHLLARMFPGWVSVGSEYAGRLVDFHPPSDLSYFILVAVPFLLTLPGVPLLRWAIRHRSLAALGPGALLGLAPFLNLWGDFNEMGTILTTRLYSAVTGYPLGDLEVFRRSSDDLMKTLTRLPELAPDVSSAARWAMALGGFVLGLALAGLIYRAASALADSLGREAS